MMRMFDQSCSPVGERMARQIPLEAGQGHAMAKYASVPARKTGQTAFPENNNPVH
jgi:hypothetical protein